MQWHLVAILFVVAAAFYFLIRWLLRRRAKKIVWRCTRYGGGGSLSSPYAMTLREVTRWLARDCNAEIGFVNAEHGFIHYRQRGG